MDFAGIMRTTERVLHPRLQLKGAIKIKGVSGLMDKVYPPAKWEAPRGKVYRPGVSIYPFFSIRTFTLDAP